MMSRLEKQEAELKRTSERRLATLLAEQRSAFEQTMKAVRVESDGKMRLLQVRRTNRPPPCPAPRARIRACALRRSAWPPPLPHVAAAHGVLVRLVTRRS